MATRRLTFAAAGTTAALAVTGSMAAASTITLPSFDPGEFEPGAPVNNRYFPLNRGATSILDGVEEDEDGNEIPVRSVFSVPGGAPRSTIAGVGVTAQRDRAFEGGRVVEDTHDYYAQDRSGNVWYLGEDVTNFIYDDAGRLVDTNDESAWIAGENGARPGYIMPAERLLGFQYYQEFAANDDALDNGTIFGTGKTVSFDSKTFEDVLQILERTELDPDAREFKYYAPGLGLILIEEGLDEAFGNPEVVVSLSEVAAVPLPAGLPLLLGGLGLMAFFRRQRT